MKVIDLIQKLGNLPENDIVQIFDLDAGKWMPVTGLTYGCEDNLVRLYSDEDF